MNLFSKFASVMNGVLNPYASVDKSKVLIIDTSHWTGLVDFQKAKSNGVSGVIIKAMDGINLTKWFKENYRGAKDAGIPVGAYTWLYSASVLSPGRQARAFLDLLKDYPCEIIPTVDFEKTNSGNPTKDDLWGFVKPFEDAFGKKPMIYSGPYYWREHGSTLNTWKDYDFWIANYGVKSPMLIMPWMEKYTLWQFTDRLDAAYYGCSGEKMLDGSYFNGTQAEFNAWIGKDDSVVVPTEPPVVIDPIPLPMTDYPKSVKLNVNLNVRSGPGTNYSIQYSLTAGKTVNITQTSPDAKGNVWGQLEDSNWICIKYGASYYVQFMGATIPSDSHMAYVLPRYVNGGPSIIAASDAPKQNHPNLYLDKSFQDYIKSLSGNRDDVWGLFSAENVGPSKGINSNGKLIYIPAVWSFNVVTVLEKSSGWAKLLTIDITKPLPPIDSVNHVTRPDLVNIMTTTTKTNEWMNFESKGSLPSPWISLQDPLLSEAGNFWIPIESILELATTNTNLNVREGAGTNFKAVGNMAKSSKTFIYQIKKDGYGNTWGKIDQNNERWICLVYGSTYYTDWKLK